MKKLFQGILFSFPIQLVILHVKKNHIQLLFWLLLLAIVTGNFGADFGMHYLFLDPEYLDSVHFGGFFWLGTAFGFFVIVWNTITYMLHSYRFPFLATLHSPFFHFCVNNSLIPAAFLFIYLAQVFQFQELYEFQKIPTILNYFSGFLSGLTISVGLFALYFSLTNANLPYLLKTGRIKKRRGKKAQIERRNWKMVESTDHIWRVDYFWTTQFHIRPVRGTRHYSLKTLQSVFQQHHNNALIFLIFALSILMGLGFLIEYPVFTFPAAASLLFVFSTLIIIAGAFSYWLMGWRQTGLIVLFLSINFAVQWELVTHRTRAYGLDYTPSAVPYNLKQLTKLSSATQIQADRAKTKKILHNWKTNINALDTTDRCQHMIVFNFSGGGSRSALWGMSVVQQLDSLLNQQLFPHTILMTGASGGMFAASYVRELYLRQQKGELVDIQDPKHLAVMAKDLGNTVMFTAAVNDIFYPFQTFQAGGYTYRKNRAYVFERQYNNNTDSLLSSRTIGDYTLLEQEAVVPLLIFAPTITNDNRKLFIAAQPVSYLTKPFNPHGFEHNRLEVDGVDFGSLFVHHNATNLLLTSAIRMSATFPYVFPNTHLPTQPVIQVVDAGLRDNEGFETCFRFLQAFQDWIKENVDQVIVVNIRSHEKVEEPESNSLTFLAKLFQPMSMLQAGTQEYQQDYYANYVDNVLDGKLEVINFEYIQTNEKARAAISLHLTAKGKKDVLDAMQQADNQESLRRIKVLFEGR